MKYPFLFFVPREENCPIKDCKVFVKIATYDYKWYNSEWMDDQQLGNSCIVPDVNICEEKYEFPSEIEALRFIQQWWAQQKISG